MWCASHTPGEGGGCELVCVSVCECVCVCGVEVAHAKLAARGYRINLYHRFTHASSSQPEGGESCIMLESRLNHSLIAKLPQHSSLTVCKFRAASEECYEQGYGRVCAKL